MHNVLKEEFEYYKDHQEEFVGKYKGKFLVIKDKEIKGVYDTQIDAYTDSNKKFALGTFLIQQVEEGDVGHSHTFYSRLAI